MWLIIKTLLTHYCLVAVKEVEESGEDLRRDVVESHHRQNGFRHLFKLGLLEVISQQCLEVLTPRTEEHLTERRKKMTGYFWEDSDGSLSNGDTLLHLILYGFLLFSCSDLRWGKSKMEN